MSSTDLIVLLFAACNTARVVSYVPQILCLLRDTGEARAVSLLSWALFTVSNASTVLYSLAILGDGRAALIFTLNAVFCAAIVAILAAKRTRLRRIGPEPAR